MPEIDDLGPRSDLRTRRLEADGGPVAIVTSPVDVDLHNAHFLQNALVESLKWTPRGVVLDLDETHFLDSSAIGTILGFKRGLQDSGIGFVLVVRPESHLLSLFRRLGLCKFLTIQNTMEGALSVLTPG